MLNEFSNAKKFTSYDRQKKIEATKQWQKQDYLQGKQNVIKRCGTLKH